MRPDFPDPNPNLWLCVYNLPAAICWKAECTLLGARAPGTGLCSQHRQCGDCSAGPSQPTQTARQRQWLHAHAALVQQRVVVGHAQRGQSLQRLNRQWGSCSGWAGRTCSCTAAVVVGHAQRGQSLHRLIRQLQ